MSQDWYCKWFNEDYLNLYSYHDQKEAESNVDFLVKIFKGKNIHRVLDVGCGVGRHSISLANRGFDVVGIDISSIVINIASKKAGGLEGNKLRFIEGDICRLKDFGKFDLVINLFTSFGYFESDRENSKMFSAIRKHLKSHGYFFFDYLHPMQVKRDLIPSELRRVKDEQVEISKEIKNDCVIKKIAFPDRFYEERVKLYDRNQIEKMLNNSGFDIVEVYNDYLGNSWNENGDRQLFLCRSKTK